MSWTITGRGIAVGPLDIGGSAAAAYSLRNLSANFTGNVVRVRRSSDNAEQDFTAAQVTNGTLTTFCGAGNGFVRTWYDQSGNGRNLGQTSTTNQPQIVSSGSLILKGTRPSLDFDGTDDRLTNAAISLPQPVTHVLIGSRDIASGSADIFFDSFDNIQHVFYNKGTSEITNQDWSFSTGAAIPPSFTYSTGTSLFLASVLFSGSASYARVNGAQRGASDTSTNALSGLSIGDIRGNPNPIINNYPLDGKISEYIIYGSNQSSSIAAIESNINAYYAIY